MRLFRQSKLGNWKPVFERMTGEVERQAAKRDSGTIHVPVSPGELIDKITILQIKSERITNPEKLAHVRSELDMLEKARADALVNSEDLALLAAELKAVNEQFWQVEDAIRGCEVARDFGPQFIELARSVCWHNDNRSALKNKINQLLKSPIAEQKEYSAYRAPLRPFASSQITMGSNGNLWFTALSRWPGPEALTVENSKQSGYCR